MIEYVRTENLKPGDMIAKSLYDENGRILIKEGKVLTETSIRVIAQYGYKGVYIDHIDQFHGESVPMPEPLVDELTQLQLMALLKDIYNNKAIQCDYFDENFMADKKKLHRMLEEIVDTLCKAEIEGKLLFELEDSRNMTSWLYFHSMKVCFLSIGMAIKLGFDKQSIMEIALGAIYHDMGKAWFADSIVNKKGLSEDERVLLRQHPETMFQFLQKHNYSIATLHAVRQHHEKISGGGYPSGVKAGKIMRSARIVAWANAYDNLVNRNPYEGCLFLNQTEMIAYLAEQEELDENCLRVLFQILAPYPVGTRVLLSNDMEGIVVKNFSQFPLRPAVVVGKDVIFLHKDQTYRNTTIKEVIK